MSRKWKPGDVAMATYRVGQCTESGLLVKVDKGWDSVTPGVGFLMHGDVITARPVVVIDPEDREQVEGLTRAFAQDATVEPSFEHLAAKVTDALRSLIAPPRPDEPTGLGAVVEDAEGKAWVHIAHGIWVHQIGPGASISREWPKVAAVRVLSEGVTA